MFHLNLNTIVQSFDFYNVFFQNPDQKEDDLSAVHVKQGFTTSYVNLTSSDEYGSALSKTVHVTFTHNDSDLSLELSLENEATYEKHNN